MKIGLGTYGLAWSIGVPGYEHPNRMNIYEFLEFSHVIGFQLVQIADNIPLDHFSDGELEKIKAFSNERAIAMEVGMRGMIPERVNKYLRIAQKLESPILRVVIDQKNFTPTLDEVHTLIRQVIPELEKYNMVLVIENHDRFKAAEFLEIIEMAGNDLVGICLDTANSIGAGEGFQSVFQTLAPYTINLHIKDFIIQRKPHMMGFEVTGVPAGQGILPITDIIQGLESFGKCESMILEQWPLPEKDIESTIKKEKDWALQSARYLFTNFQ